MPLIACDAGNNNLSGGTNAGDQITELVGQGFDAMRSKITSTIRANVEQLVDRI